MKFFYAKHDLSCKYCRGGIQRGEFCVRTSYKNKDTGEFYGFCYHPDCYIEDFKSRFTRSCIYWKQQQIPPKKLGRPRKFTDPVKAQRLKCLLNYHKSFGHMDRVEEIQEEIKELERR